MESKVLIPAGSVSENELDDLVSTIANMKHADYEIEKQFVVTSDSPALLAALTALFQEGPVAEAAPKVKVKVKRKNKLIASDGVKPAPTRGPHVRSIKVIASGEMISRFELNKRLAAHAIAAGTTLHSPKYRTITVKNGGLEGEPYTVVNESGELV